MNAYEIRYNGLWLGGIMIVVAYTKEEAETIAREEIVKRFPNDEIEVTNIIPLKDQSIIYNYDGDY